MNDLHDLMYRSSDGDPNRSADPMALLRQGRRRVHRRRGVAAVSGTAAASLAIAGAIAWLPSSPHDGSSSDSQPPVAAGQTKTGAGAYEPVEVSRAEVGERCTTLFHNAYGSDQTLVVPPGIDGPWFEGRTAWVTDVEPDTHGRFEMRMSCEVPQAGLVDRAGTVSTPLPDPSNTDGIREACGQYLGFDFTGWKVVTAAGTDLALTAVLRSTNGYVATCSLNVPPGDQGDHPYVAISREGPPQTEGLENDYAVWFGSDQYAGDNQEGDYSVNGVDQISGPENAAEIVLVEPDGTEHVTPVADNGWFTIAEKMHLKMFPYGESPLRIKVLDADGNVLADYPDGEQTRECEVHPDLCEPQND
jgi:hypothetical protein